MNSKPFLRGMATATYWSEDVKAARNWYTQLFGIEPYFQMPDAADPAYIEYRIGDDEDEFGIIHARYAPNVMRPGPGGVIVYWHVDDIQAALNRLIEMGAKECEPITNRGEGFVTASVIDPFGNILGIMYNPHFAGKH